MKRDNDSRNYCFDEYNRWVRFKRGIFRNKWTRETLIFLSSQFSREIKGVLFDQEIFRYIELSYTVKVKIRDKAVPQTRWWNQVNSGNKTRKLYYINTDTIITIYRGPNLNAGNNSFSPTNISKFKASLNFRSEGKSPEWSLTTSWLGVHRKKDQKKPNNQERRKEGRKEGRCS